jgi:hypothetical protein
MQPHNKIAKYGIGAAILRLALAACTASSNGQQPSGGQVLKEVANVPMPGPAVRFDYQNFDVEQGRLYIAHMNADQLVVFDSDRSSPISTGSNVCMASSQCRRSGASTRRSQVSIRLQLSI